MSWNLTGGLRHMASLNALRNTLLPPSLKLMFWGRDMPSNGHPLGLAVFWAAARKIYPGWSVRVLKSKLDLVLSCVKASHELSELLDQPQYAALIHELKERPEILGFVQWPYIHAGWLLTHRFEALSQHRQAVCTDMFALNIDVARILVVADLSNVSPGLRLTVDQAPWCLREGSLVFNQFLGEERMMSLAFSFGWRNGERVVYVGSVQGSNIDSALAKYRDIAKKLQGMRSRDFLVKCFQFLMYHLGVEQVLCIQDSQRHHRHSYFGISKVDKLHLNYDEIWLEHAGELTPAGFYRLPALPKVRPIEEIAAKNRALYRRRYEMMDKLSNDIRSRFGKAPQNIESAF